MNLGVTLKSAEKVFGPALPGPGSNENTLSAVRYAEGKGKKFAGIIGLHENAKFYIHFPTSIDWNLLASKKGTPDFVNDLKESGPQGEQGREAQVADFLAKYEVLQNKLRLKQAVAGKKTRDAERKKQAVELRERFGHWVGEKEASITIGSECLNILLKITRDKNGKLKISGVL